MESPALVWLPAYYATSKIPFVLSHEVAHQWFYGVVGNDQTTNPFLDEAMAEFLARSWFGFRGSNCATRRLDLSMYAYSPSCYYEQVYVQGSSFLNKLRKDMGSAKFWGVVRTFWHDSPIPDRDHEAAAGRLQGQGRQLGAAPIPRPLPVAVLRRWTDAGVSS